MTPQKGKKCGGRQQQGLFLAHWCSGALADCAESCRLGPGCSLHLATWDQPPPGKLGHGLLRVDGRAERLSNTCKNNEALYLWASGTFHWPQRITEPSPKSKGQQSAHPPGGTEESLGQGAAGQLQGEGIKSAQQSYLPHTG